MFRFDERTLKNVAINARDNDVSLMAADICVSCFHFIEHALHQEPVFGGKLQAFPRLRLLTDIANTRKHLRRHKASRQVDLIARLAYEINAAGLCGFIQTEIIAVDADGQQHDVFQLLLEFTEFVRDVGSFGPPMEVTRPKPRSYQKTAVARLTYETLAMEQTSYSFWRRDADGTYLPARAGTEVELEIVLDIAAEQQFGRFKLLFDLQEIGKWFDPALGSLTGKTDQTR